MRPEISVIVPVYNVGKQFLCACIESVLIQSFSDFELILVDDASTDGSVAVCEKYLNDKRVKLIKLPQNGGPSNARNQGVYASVSPYITFLDADDRLQPQALEIFRKIAKETGADIVSSSINGSYKTAPVKIFSPTEAVAVTLYQKHLDCSAWGKIYRREICEAEPFRSGRYEDLRTFPYLFLRANRIAFTPQKLYHYTYNPTSYIHTFNPDRAVVLDVTEEIVNVMESNYPELAPAAHDRALSAAFNIFNLLTANRVSAPEIEKRCKATICRYRQESLFNRRVRPKNKLGILLSYLGGFPALRLAAFFLQKP